jgi:RNA polymerase sigma-70 factor (ECF subfamily)
MRQLDNRDWQKFCRGDTNALERIYSRHKDSLFSYCLYASGDRQLSEDVVQEAFLRLMEQRGRLKIRTTLKNWLFICTRNLLINCMKKDNRQVLSLSGAADVSSAMSIETKLFIENVLDKLAVDQRELILLREQQRFTIREIADMLCVSESSIKVRLYRVRKKMREIGKQAI